MQIAFTLTMPNRGSWNGQWSGQGNLYSRVRSLSKGEAERVLSQSSYYYGWSDGWGALVSVRAVTASEARTLRRKSKGFSGYDWMIDSIIERGKILASHEIEEAS